MRCKAKYVSKSTSLRCRLTRAFVCAGFDTVFAARAEMESRNRLGSGRRTRRPQHYGFPTFHLAAALPLHHWISGVMGWPEPPLLSG